MIYLTLKPLVPHHSVMGNVEPIDDSQGMNLDLVSTLTCLLRSQNHLGKVIIHSESPGKVIRRNMELITATQQTNKYQDQGVMSCLLC